MDPSTDEAVPRGRPEEGSPLIVRELPDLESSQDLFLDRFGEDWACHHLR